jgi:hypothetical protein
MRTKLKSLFHRHKHGESNTTPQALASTSTEPTVGDSWQGNLPCVHGPHDGCNNHNPRRHSIHFDPSLFEPVARKIKPATHLLDPDTPTSYSIPSLSSPLPRDPSLGYLTTLPPIHSSAPFSLAFYHVHLLLSHHRAGTLDPAAHLALLSCVANTGQNPLLSWVVAPLITASDSLLVETTMAFLLRPDLGSWTPSSGGLAAARHALIGSGYRSFRLCAHTRLGFTSHWGSGTASGTQTAGVGFVMGLDDGGEVEGRWESEGSEEGDGELVVCGKCWTETVVTFKLVRGQTLVNVQVYKDVGTGQSPQDEKWMALVGDGVEVRRSPEDVMGMRREFEAMYERGQAAESA